MCISRMTIIRASHWTQRTLNSSVDSSISHFNYDMLVLYDICSNITSELVDSCVAILLKGNATGPDDLSVEHIIYAHPRLCVAICHLFKLIVSHRYVPKGFWLRSQEYVCLLYLVCRRHDIAFS